MGFLSPEVTWTICSVRFLEKIINFFRIHFYWKKYPGRARLQAAARRALTNMSDGTRSATLWGDTWEVLKQPAPTPAINPVAPELPSIQPGNGSFQVPMTNARDNLIREIRQRTLSTPIDGRTIASLMFSLPSFKRCSASCFEKV